MTELTYAQAAVLCRVEGMPIDSQYAPGYDWKVVSADPYYSVSFTRNYRLTPNAALTPDQAATCLARGVEVEYYDTAVMAYLKMQECDCYLSTEYRVPPETVATQ